MTYYVYLLRCGDDSLYCGITNNVAARVLAHAAGKGARYTRGRGPLELVLARRCRDKSTALKLEYAIKQLDRARKLALDRAQISRGSLDGSLGLVSAENSDDRSVSDPTFDARVSVGERW